MLLENMESFIAIVTDLFAQGEAAWYVVISLLALLTVIALIRGLHSAVKRSIESRHFLFFCIPVLLWVALHLTCAYLGLRESDPWLTAAFDALKAFVLATLCLHVWSQVSYKPITALVALRYLTVPVLLAALVAVKYMEPRFDVGLMGQNNLTIQSLLLAGFGTLVLARSYLLCFNVFYQMPKHMRRSTHRMLVAITAIALAWLWQTAFVMSAGFMDMLTALSFGIAVFTLFSAFFIANSSNVIVTSREFVFASLSTVVITISLKGNILDWNKKSPGADILLPKPKYKEPYENYRKRIISTCNGITSPHDENIITTTVDGIEQHYLFTPHEIGFQGRNFGRLVEISEVTKSYSVLRYLEEIALYDTLTGLKNRNAYIDAVKRMVASKNMPLAIIVGDINNLKKTNDTLGHLYGDRLLMAITSIVTECAPEGALVFRIGGDELVLLVPNAEPQAVLDFEAQVAEKCEHASQLEFGTPSISWGHALMTSVSQDYNEVFRFADAMMYENKRTSKEISISGIVHTDKPLDSLPPEVVQEMR